MEAMLASAGEIRQKDPLGALRALAVNGLVRLATNARTQAVFDVIFHKCEFAAEFASVAGRRHATDTGCLANVERLLKQAVTRRAAPAQHRHRARGALSQCVHGRRDARMGAAPEAYDLAQAAPAMIDCVLAGLVARPPLRSRAASRRARGVAAVRHGPPGPAPDQRAPR